MDHKTENAAALIGGLALGALTMFLLDPEMGTRRRHAVADATSDTLSSAQHSVHDALGGAVHSTTAAAHKVVQAAQDAVHSTMHGGQEQVGRLGRYTKYAKNVAGKVAGRVGSAATDFASHLSEHASDLASRASELSDHLSTLAGGAAAAATDSAKSTAQTGSSYIDQLRAQVARELADIRKSAKKAGLSSADQAKAAAGETHHPIATATGLTAGGLALLAGGAAAMYYLDPARGRGRRAKAADQAFSYTRRAGKQARGLGRHVGNRITGYAAEAQRAVPESWRSQVKETFGSQESPSMPSPRPTAR